LSLLDLLRSGGYILYARHGEATVGFDQPDLSFQDCSTQRNLSFYGQRQAVRYGELLRSLQIPVSYPVISSPFCRAVETAQLAFGQENVQTDPFFVHVYRLSGDLPSYEQSLILNALASRLEIVPPPGTNTVIIAHSFPAGIGLGQITDMGTVIVRPLGTGNGYEIIGKLSLADLEET
jgi:hypothetical protein